MAEETFAFRFTPQEVSETVIALDRCEQAYGHERLHHPSEVARWRRLNGVRNALARSLGSPPRSWSEFDGKEPG